MSTSPAILSALDRCIEDLENMSEDEKLAFAEEYWDFVEQQEEKYGPRQYDKQNPHEWRTVSSWCGLNTLEENDLSQCAAKSFELDLALETRRDAEHIQAASVGPLNLLAA